MDNLKINKLDLIILGITLESINIKTPIGHLSIALITILITNLFLIFNLKKYNINSSRPLLIFALWISLISVFQGNSLIGNLVRCYSLVYIGSIIPDLNLENNKLVNSLRKILTFHCFILYFDYLFVVPWGWDGEDLFRIGIFNNLNRATGLFLEPSYFGLTINLILLLLVISKQVKKIDFILVIVAGYCCSSLSAVLGTVLIIISHYLRFFLRILKNIFINRKIIKSKGKYFIYPFLFVLLISLNFNKRDIGSRLRNPYYDSSSLSRIFGSYFTFKNIIKNSPIYGYGLGGDNIDNILNSFGATFTLDQIGGSEVITQHSGNRIFKLSLVNIFVVLTFIGGVPLLLLFNYYLLNSFGISIYLFIFIILSFFTGSIWNVIYFLTPSISKLLINNNKE